MHGISNTLFHLGDALAALTEHAPPGSGAPQQVPSRCWTVDFELDADDNPYAIFQARIDPGPVSSGGESLDHMFFYARYDGTNWHWHKLAHAGRDIYAASPNGGEDDDQ